MGRFTVTLPLNMLLLQSSKLTGVSRVKTSDQATKPIQLQEYFK
jgi:hypothetical protein